MYSFTIVNENFKKMLKVANLNFKDLSATYPPEGWKAMQTESRPECKTVQSNNMTKSLLLKRKVM